jgi:hypothetical protein
VSNPNIDYFAKPKSLEEAIIRRIKGDHRKAFIAEAIKQDGLDSIPPQWTAHELGEMFKMMLTSRNPRNRGGEDLPDLEEGEVEIARVSLADSVHGEVTSLRVRRDGNAMALRLVDEYQTEFELPTDRIEKPFTDTELVEFLADCEPCPFETDCRLRIASPFHQSLQSMLDERLGRDEPNEEDE